MAAAGQRNHQAAARQRRHCQGPDRLGEAGAQPWLAHCADRGQWSAWLPDRGRSQPWRTGADHHSPPATGAESRIGALYIQRNPEKLAGIVQKQAVQD
jgi:hypothetical protein